MLTETIQYEDFDERPASKTLHFNISKAELSENLHLKDTLESLHDRLSGPERELTPQEVQEVVNLVKTFMRLSYGVREGDRFVKSEQVWTDFTQTAAYDAFLFSLFENPIKAIDFLTGVLPKALREEAAKFAGPEMAKAREIAQNAVQDTPLLQTAPAVLEPVNTDERASLLASLEVEGSDPVRHWDSYTRDELLEMSDDDFHRLVGTSDPTKMELPQLQVAVARKYRG